MKDKKGNSFWKNSPKEEILFFGIIAQFDFISTLFWVFAENEIGVLGLILKSHFVPLGFRGGDARAFLQRFQW